MIQESVRWAVQEGHFFRFTSLRKAALQRCLGGNCLPAAWEMQLLERCFWGMLCSQRFFGALPQANHAVSLLFFPLEFLSPGLSWWFGFHWSLPSRAEAGGCPGEGVSEPESGCRGRGNSLGCSGGVGRVGPGGSGVQGKDVEQEGLCEGAGREGSSLTLGDWVCTSVWTHPMALGDPTLTWPRKHGL